MFVDRAKIYVQAGNGGNGCESFYYHRMIRHKRRDGGDGGRGGDVILQTDENIQTLLDFKFRQHFKAGRGKNGSSNGKRGHDGAECLIQVPAGTVVRNFETGLLVRDLNHPGERVVAARGGSGGVGNARHREPTAGDPGETLTLLLELKLIADAGLVGFPNAGKSSLINALSNAHSKVASFPFTTLQPELGVLMHQPTGQRVVIADIPGIIADAHKGKGLGIDFLRHIERTRVLIIVVDMAGSDLRDPNQDFLQLIQELAAYDQRLLQRPRIIVANKMDQEAAAENLATFRSAVTEPVLPVSCVTGAGLEQLVAALLAVAPLPSEKTTIQGPDHACN